jgi:hypothetical protein
MGSLSDFAELELLDHLFNATYVHKATVYLALCTATVVDSDDGSTITECADAQSYARVAIAFSAAANRKIIQNGDVDFAQADASWGTVTDWAIMDGNTHGADEVLAYGEFASSFEPVAGNTPTVESLEVEVEIVDTATGAGLSTYAVHGLLSLMFLNNSLTFGTTADDTFVMLMSVVADDDDADTDDLTELTGTDYARVEVNKNAGAAPAWDLAAAGVVDNTQAITIGPPTADDWDEVVAMAICDATSGTANVLCYDNANIVDQTPLDGDTVQFAIGALDITMT